MQYPADRHPVLAASYWLPPLTLLVLIYLLSSGPVPSSIPTFKFMDKLAHACVFSALAFLLMRAFISGGPDMTTSRAALVCFVLVCLYGVADELHQYFVPSRHCDVFDAMADAFGAFLGVMTGLSILRGRVPH